jgi:FtsZ-binding cell division protein ZapB
MLQHLEKATQMAMTMNVLLQQEIEVLRAENERKLKKKVRRRGKIGDDLFLS